LPGVHTTAVGYAGGYTPNPTYEEVCSGRTGHNEVVLVVFDPAQVSYEELLQGLLGIPRPHPGHAPGQRRRHPVPLGIYVYGDPSASHRRRASRARYAEALAARGLGPITTEIREAPPFYYAEDYHQQYLAKNPAATAAWARAGA
jgi:peptide-methionine (S)-S-oxide reductase